ncbi:MAG: adenosylmethionine decarboxylase [Azospirillum sp.]|nr:adenosylmethionine decarboxylase [Azospirillum sp.]MCA3265011.1 adenosylmethionine decarboxylase [Azospirillum sp.]
MAKNAALRNLKVVSGDRPASVRKTLDIEGLNSQATAEPVLSTMAVPEQTVAKDHFVERNGVKFAGTHLLIELWGAKNLGDAARTEAALREGAVTAGATILHCHLHHFGPNAGLSGVLVLAESHISIHTWPEREYAAIDVFMCGVCDPYKTLPAIKRAFEPASVQIVESRRGVMA